MNKDLAKELINAGVHFGHGVSRWNPKMAPYIFTKRGKIHIIDIRRTIAGILIAKKLVAEVVASGKDVVFVGTKRQAQKVVEKAAQECSMHWVSERWLGGTLTNFRTIRSRLQRLEELEAMQTDGSMEKESKKQAARWKRELANISTNLGGIREMSRLPGLVVVIDTRKENIALAEAKKLGIPTIGVIDTDSDPDVVDVAIPANDDSIKGNELILNELVQAVAAGKTMQVTNMPDEAAKAKRSRSRSVLASAEKTEAPAVAVEEPKQEQVGEEEKSSEA